MTQKKISEATLTLGKALKKDKDLFFAYQSNIAMSFCDVFQKISPDTIEYELLHSIANQAAEKHLKEFIG